MKRGERTARRGTAARARSGTARPAPSLPAAPGAERAAAALWIALVALALLRAALAFVPSMWGWGGNLLRFLPPPAGWLPWLLATLALVPAVSRRLVPAFERGGDFVARRPVPAALLLGLLAASCVLAFPDRLYFLGDYTLRLGAARGAIPPERVFPQVLPLDRWLHYDLPVALRTLYGWDPELTERIAGALKAALLAAIAVAYARALRLRGTAALAAACAVLGGAYLGLLTGYGKAFGELMLVTGLVGVCGVRLVHGDGTPLPLGIALAIGFALHRSALALLAPAAVAWALWLRAGGRVRDRAAWTGIALPLVSLAFALPAMISAMKRIDPEHFAASARAAEHASSFVLRAADIANQLWLLAPLAPLVLVLAPALRSHLAHRRDGRLIAALAAPLFAMMLVVQPRQGLFRDLDVFAATGVAVALAAAWLVAETLRGAPRHAWLGPAVALAALVPAVQWLAQEADTAVALDRVRAYLHGPPLRPDTERAVTWSWIAGRALALGRPAEAADAYREAVAIAPNPRFLYEWGLAESEAGHPAEAAGHFAAAVARLPGRPDLWEALAGAALRAGDRAGARVAAESTLRLQPGSPAALDVLRALERADPARTRNGP